MPQEERRKQRVRGRMVRIGDRLRRVFQKNQFRSDPSLRNWLQTIRRNQYVCSKSVCPLEIIDIHYIRRASREIIPVFIAGAGNYQRIAALCGFSLLYRVLPLLDRKLTSTVTNPSKAFIVTIRNKPPCINPKSFEVLRVLSCNKKGSIVLFAPGEYRHEDSPAQSRAI